MQEANLRVESDRFGACGTVHQGCRGRSRALAGLAAVGGCAVVHAEKVLARRGAPAGSARRSVGARPRLGAAHGVQVGAVAARAGWRSQMVWAWRVSCRATFALGLAGAAQQQATGITSAGPEAARRASVARCVERWPWCWARRSSTLPAVGLPAVPGSGRGRPAAPMQCLAGRVHHQGGELDGAKADDAVQVVQRHAQGLELVVVFDGEGSGSPAADSSPGVVR